MKKILILVFINIKLFATSHTFILENDALTGTDKHYTNGFFYTWMSEENDEDIPNWLNIEDIAVDNMAISLSHLTFTPGDLSDPNVIVDDMPYAGYLNLNFFLYQSMQNFFHEIGLGIGIVGPLAQSQRIQNEIHRFTGNRAPQGWNNQLKNDFLANASYQFAYKTNKKNFNLFKYNWTNLEFDWTNNVRVDLGEFYSGALVGTSLRFGSFIPNNFKTTGNFIGGEESALLNFGHNDGFDWSISLGYFLNSIKRFYVVDEYEEYQLSHLNYTRGKVVTFNIYYDNFEFALKLKSTYVQSNSTIEGLEEELENLDEDSVKKWGGLTFRWKFDEGNRKVPDTLDEKDIEDKEKEEIEPLQKDTEDSTTLPTLQQSQAQ